MRITNNGNLVYCRWSDKFDNSVNIKDVDPKTFFQEHMSGIRRSLLQGQAPAGCNRCYHMDQYGKVSGRQRQLLKTGIRLEQFEKTVLSSPWHQHWLSTYDTGHTDQLPQDWQIDLGNFCNSACVFCSPNDSSRLANEWRKIGFIDQMPAANWTDSPELVSKFIDILKSSQHIQYLHFIGGETVITPAFRQILTALVDTGISKTATVGFTTNLTVWDQDIVDLLDQFSTVNLGMSVEAFDPVNDYARWPSKIQQVIGIRDRWVAHGKARGWFMQLRTTPTLLTIGKLLSIYKYAWDNEISVESCNFLQRPECLRPSVLPAAYKNQYVEEMQSWLGQYNINDKLIVNSRDPNVVHQYLLQDLQSYVNYLRDEPDESYRLNDTVQYLKALEASRGNCVLNYLPEYEKLFRSAGY